MLAWLPKLLGNIVAEKAVVVCEVGVRPKASQRLKIVFCFGIERFALTLQPLLVFGLFLRNLFRGFVLDGQQPALSLLSFLVTKAFERLQKLLLELLLLLVISAPGQRMIEN
jgi:hypothetical protein